MRTACKVRVEDPAPPDESVIEELLILVLRPEGDVETDRLIVPLKPLRLVRVMTLVADEPLETLIDVGFVEIEKSPAAVEVTVTDTEAECESDPLEPVTVTV